MIEISRVTVKDRRGTHTISARLLHEFGHGDGYLTYEKIRDIWMAASRHEVLFSDRTMGKLEPFISMLLNPRSVWVELFSEDFDEVIGAAYITRVIPMFDCYAHFAFWDSVMRGREAVFEPLKKWIFEKYDLQRISCEIPAYQHKTIRMAKRIGFVSEGVRREAVMYKGEWFSLIMLGMLRREVENVGRSVRIGEVGDSHGNSGSNSGSGEGHSESDSSGRAGGS